MPGRPVIFDRSFPNATWGYANLNELAKRDFPAQGENPSLDPEKCDVWQRGISRELGVDFNFGGYDEIRDCLWRGHYHNPQVMRHRGVDYNVPAGTQVTAPARCKVVYVYRDSDQNGGWGGLVHFELLSMHSCLARYFCYGHLAQSDLPKVGDILLKGEMVGSIGTPQENGGWFPHLHLQRYLAGMNRTYQRLERMDGYGPNDQSVTAEYPDPTEIAEGYFL